ncbi:MAG TPA: hypothetical protein DCS93_17155 [Microscillaceae bacterium]|nr:hypothetical protein [Microscillaceae bacterium]
MSNHIQQDHNQDSSAITQNKQTNPSTLQTKQRSIQAKQRPIQAKQRPIQAKQRPIQAKQRPIQAKQRPIQRNLKPSGKSHTGNEAQIKANVGAITGVDVSDTQVHYNSSKPVQLKAEAYAQGNEVHLASGKEQHLGHELAHVVQQKQGRVKPTIQGNNGVGINNDPQLEHEADVIGEQANQSVQAKQSPVQRKQISSNAIVQRKESEEEVPPVDPRFTEKEYKFTSMIDGKMGSVYFNDKRIRLTHGGGPEIEDDSEHEYMEQYHVPRQAYGNFQKQQANINKKGVSIDTYIKQQYKWVKQQTNNQQLTPMQEDTANENMQLVEFYRDRKTNGLTNLHPSRGVAVRQNLTQKEINAIVLAAKYSEGKSHSQEKNEAFYNHLNNSGDAANIIGKVRTPKEVASSAKYQELRLATKGYNKYEGKLEKKVHEHADFVMENEALKNDYRKKRAWVDDKFWSKIPKRGKLKAIDKAYEKLEAGEANVKNARTQINDVKVVKDAYENYAKAASKDLKADQAHQEANERVNKIEKAYIMFMQSSDGLQEALGQLAEAYKTGITADRAVKAAHSPEDIQAAEGFYQAAQDNIKALEALVEARKEHYEAAKKYYEIMESEYTRAKRFQKASKAYENETYKAAVKAKKEVEETLNGYYALLRTQRR